MKQKLPDCRTSKFMVMKTKKNFRVRVMKYAHQLYVNGAGEWSECVTKAWGLYKLAKRMREGVVNFLYRKTNGQFRYAVGTLHNMPAGATLNGRKVTKPSYKTFAYYDMKRSAMRCFRVENLIEVY